MNELKNINNKLIKLGTNLFEVFVKRKKIPNKVSN